MMYFKYDERMHIYYVSVLHITVCVHIKGAGSISWTPYTTTTGLVFFKWYFASAITVNVSVD